MSHTADDKDKMIARVRRIRGLVDAVERALEEEAGCEKVLHLIAGVRGAVTGLMGEVVEDHIKHHLVDPEKHPDALDHTAVAALVDVVRSYLK
jgi:DNA-binding FrmR family transcriptional regulator